MEDNPDLSSFRAAWQAELRGQPPPVAAAAQTEQAGAIDEALMLQLQGMELEDAGRLREAVSCYRRAAKMEPGIEFRAHNHLRQQQQQQLAQPPATGAEPEAPADSEAVQDLLPLFSGSVCEPATETGKTHVGHLPPEIMAKIFRRVIGFDLDLAPLVRLGQVCRQWYVVSHEFKVWMSAAKLIWGPGTRLESPWTSWRDLCIRKCRPFFHGVYIGHYSYTRAGEQSLDSFYRPIHLVEYYRFLRLFPDGTCVSFTSAESPETVVPRLKRLSTLSKHADLLHGTYELSGDELLVSVRKKAEGNGMGQSPGHFQFYMGFRIQPHRQRPSRKLVWTSYVCHLFRTNAVRPVVTEYTVNEGYKPFYFARVRSLSWDTGDDDVKA